MYISFLPNQTFGKIIVVIVGIGLLSHAFWRIFSAFYDSKNEDSNKVGYAKRISYFLSGLAYAALGVSATIAGFSGK